MKNILTIIGAICITAFRADAVLTDSTLPPAQAYTADYAVMASLALPNTNAFSITNQVDQNLYHTFHVYCSTGLNGGQFAIDESLDTTNFVLGATNTITGSVFKTNFVFKTTYFRMRFLGTNLVGAANYLGGR